MSESSKFSDTADRLAKAAIYSEVPEINARLIDILPELNLAGLVFEDARPIPYGTRIQLRSGEKEIGMNLYHSKKKGFSLVVDKKVPVNTADRVQGIILQTGGVNAISPQPVEQTFRIWIGSDEAGKGDFLGPLVVAAFRSTRDMADKLRNMGVRDSKTVSDSQCRKIARDLFRDYKNEFEVVELPPKTYNRMYEDFRNQNKKLNELLAWGHGKAIRNLMNSDVEAVIIDKFAKDRTLMANLDRKWRIISRSRAEDNVAVAAASILARARYLFRLDKLSDQFKVKLPPGAGDAVVDAAREVYRKHGSEALNHIAKLHFKNTQKIGYLFDGTNS